MIKFSLSHFACNKKSERETASAIFDRYPLDYPRAKDADWLGKGGGGGVRLLHVSLQYTYTYTYIYFIVRDQYMNIVCPMCIVYCTCTNTYMHMYIAGIGIEEINAGIGIPASQILVRYWTKKILDCVTLIRYRTCSGIVSFFQSGTGLTGCQTTRHSGISTYMYMDIDMDMKH